MKTPKNDLLTTSEVADFLRTPVSTLRYWRQVGRGPSSFRIGARVVYDREELARWLDEQREATSSNNSHRTLY